MAPIPRTELVLGLVGPVGTDLKAVCGRLETRLSQFGYGAATIRVSELFKVLGHPIDETTAYARITSGMDAGNRIREEAKQGDVLALAVLSKVREARRKKPDDGRPQAYIVWSLKHPDEVQLLRRVYGPGFFLVGLQVPRELRLNHLVSEVGLTRDQAVEVVGRDEHEVNELGQHTRDAFQLADVFVNPREEQAGDTLWRFLDLVFGCPFHSPTREEHAMFMAFAASLRSGSLSRQVGAAIASEGGDIVSTGANDVACFGGGLYWPGEADQRDFKLKLGEDSNEREKRTIITEVLQKLGLADKDYKALRDTRLWDITEYGRDVHAEMEALMACARTGVTPRRGTLFCTTFPCHNCAKHIVAAGIEKVVYIEPYPKSRALDLFDDSLTVDEKDEGKKVLFVPFMGVGPRRYFDLFSMTLGTGYSVKRKTGGVKSEWNRALATPRVPLLPVTYEDEEKAGIELLEQIYSRERTDDA